MRACARAVSVALTVLVVVLATDRFLEPADATMVVLAIAACVLSVTFAFRTLWPLRRTPSDTQVARFIEEQCPDLEDRLASATEVARAADTSALGELLLVDAAAKARSVDLDSVVASDHVRGSILRGAAATAAFLVVFAAGSGPVSRIARTAWLHAFPYSVTLEIEPGDVRIVAGEPVTIVARLEDTFGAPSRTPPSVMVTNVDGTDHTLEMEATAEGYQAVMPSIEADLTYHVAAATLVSDEYRVTALFPPKVAQVDVAYQYPAFTRLPPRVETDSGDIYAPEGTEVTLTVHTDKMVRRGGLVLESGGRLLLVPLDDGTLQAAFTVSEDDTYRIAVVDDDGLSSSADVDYFIRTVLDRPPEVEITRPAGDRDITPLEEAVIEVRVPVTTSVLSASTWSMPSSVSQVELSVSCLGQVGTRPVDTRCMAKSSNLNRGTLLVTTRGRSTPIPVTAPARFGAISTFFKCVPSTRSSRARRARRRQRWMRVRSGTSLRCKRRSSSRPGDLTVRHRVNSVPPMLAPSPTHKKSSDGPHQGWRSVCYPEAG